jgi:SRSO17 transposase
MAVASIETTLELWASSLREVKRRILSLFAQGRTAASAGLFIDGLLGEERRKTGWMSAEAAGDPGPWRQQELLGRDLGCRCPARSGARLCYRAAGSR